MFIRTPSINQTRAGSQVNNAGATWGEPIDTHPASAFDKLMALNVRSVFSLTQKCLSLLRAAATAADPARVINIGSVLGINVGLSDTYARAKF